MAQNTAQTSQPEGGLLHLWPLALVAIVLGFALFGERGVLHLVKLNNLKADLQGQLESAQKQNDALRDEIASLGSDRRYLERLARTELGMVREDELVFQFNSQTSTR